MTSIKEYPTYTRMSPQTRVTERLGKIETRGGKRFFVPAKAAEIADTGPFLTPDEKDALAKLHANKSPINGKRKNKGRYNFHQRQAIVNEVNKRRADKERAERALARKAKGYL